MKLTLHPVLFKLTLALSFAVFLRGQATAPRSVLATTESRFELTPGDATLPLKPRSGVALKKQLDALPPSRQLYLVVSGLQASTPPGVLYALYLEPSGTQTPSASARAGYLNFYAVSAGAKSPPVSFEVTSIIRALLAAKPDLSGLQVRIVPADHPQSNPSIGNIELIAD